MNNQSQCAARFWFEASTFFENITLLAEAIAREMDNNGYKAIKIIHGNKYDVWNTGVGRLMADRIQNHWYGLFEVTPTTNNLDTTNHDDEVDIDQSQQGDTSYGFGITFGVYDPGSPVDPWIPLVYLYKGTCKPGKKWETWRYNRTLFTPSNLLKEYDKQKKCILSFYNIPAFPDINCVSVIAFELGKICSISDVRAIIKPSIEALRSGVEESLNKIKEEKYLLCSNIDWRLEEN